MPTPRFFLTSLPRFVMSTADMSGLRPLETDDLQPVEQYLTDDAAILRRVQRIARLMDSSMSIPGTPIRFGLDSALGLIPGIGDIGTAAISGWIMLQAHQSGLPKRRLARMAANIAVDLTIGAIPLLGDLFDVYWKSNLRNARLLEEHLKTKIESTGTQS